METVQPISQTEEYIPAKRKKSKKKGMLFLLLALIVLGAGAYAFSRSQSSNAPVVNPTPEFASPTEEPSPTESIDESPTPEEEEVNTPTPTKNATPTPKAAATKSSELNIQVLNGSGEAGVGATAKTFLSDKGYEFIETGNADNYDYESVTIKSKESVSDYISTLKSDLEEKYTISSESETLSEDSIFDVVIIVGK